MSPPKFSPGVFVTGHTFQRGDLPLYIWDPAGNPAAPYAVTYTLFYYAPGSSCAAQAGPADRVPATLDSGEYYVTGVAGSCGQPGDWYVRWVWQESFGSQKVEVIFPFKVFDSSQYSLACNGGCS